MNNVDHYTYRVFWSADDGENVGVCTEFPGLSHLAKDPTHALAGIRDLVAFVVADLRKAKKEVPKPLGAQKYSGHLHVRLPPNVHRELAFLAHEAGTSLNRVIVDRLAGGTFVRASHKPVRSVSKKTAKAARTRAKKSSANA
jgi:predicted HicB family RNase H-like nuclease